MLVFLEADSSHCGHTVDTIYGAFYIDVCLVFLVIRNILPVILDISMVFIFMAFASLCLSQPEWL